MPIHALGSYTLVLHVPHAICYTRLAVDSHTVHFQTTTRNKHTYEPACCVGVRN